MVRTIWLRMIRYANLAGIVAVPVAGALVAVHAASFVNASNLERLERCAADIADSLFVAVDQHDSLCVSMVAHDAAWLLERVIVERAGLRGISVWRCMPSDPHRVDVAIRSISVVYRETDDGDIEREARLDVSANVAMPIATAGSGQLRALQMKASRIDTVAASDTSTLDRSGYPFATGVTIASTPGGFWKKIIEPAVVLAASAIVVILLFTVRSQ